MAKDSQFDNDKARIKKGDEQFLLIQEKHTNSKSSKKQHGKIDDK